MLILKRFLATLFSYSGVRGNYQTIITLCVFCARFCGHYSTVYAWKYVIKKFMQLNLKSSSCMNLMRLSIQPSLKDRRLNDFILNAQTI